MAGGNAVRAWKLWAVRMRGVRCTELRRLIKESGVSERRFCAYLQIRRLEDLEASRFEAACQALRREADRSQGVAPRPPPEPPPGVYPKGSLERESKLELMRFVRRPGVAPPVFKRVQKRKDAESTASRLRRLYERRDAESNARLVRAWQKRNAEAVAVTDAVARDAEERRVRLLENRQARNARLARTWKNRNAAAVPVRLLKKRRVKIQADAGAEGT